MHYDVCLHAVVCFNSAHTDASVHTVKGTHAGLNLVMMNPNWLILIVILVIILIESIYEL